MLDLNELLVENQRLTDDGQSNFLDNFVQLPQKDGFLNIRLLPPAADGMFNRKKNIFVCKTRLHRVNNKSVHCPRELVNTSRGARWQGECPICDRYNKLWEESKTKSPEEAERLQQMARAIKPYERFYYNCIVRSTVDPKTNETIKNVGPKILSVGKTLHAKIVQAIVGNPEADEEALGDVTDFKSGRDFKIIVKYVKSGNQMFPNYDASKFLDSSPLGDPDQIENWMKNLHDLTALRVIKSQEELLNDLMIHFGEKDDPAATSFDPAAMAEESSDSSASLAEDDFISGLKQKLNV